MDKTESRDCYDASSSATLRRQVDDQQDDRTDEHEGNHDSARNPRSLSLVEATCFRYIRTVRDASRSLGYGGSQQRRGKSFQGIHQGVAVLHVRSGLH